nr:hypothetical protein HK105_004605 [Polyrhizophydium stewartii]
MVSASFKSRRMLRSASPLPSPVLVADPAPRTVFVGLFTTAAKLHRRSLIRATCARLAPPDVEFRFVVGRPKEPELALQAEFEQSAHGDMLVLDCDENMNDGKTFTYFTHIGRAFKSGDFRFVMKADDDAWLDLRNLAAWLRTMPEKGVYFGREVPRFGFMAGMGYGVSLDVARAVATADIPDSIRIGQEDASFATLLYRLKLIEHWTTDKAEAFYDSPQSKEGWAHPYTDNTILIHRLKRDDWFLETADHFMPRDKHVLKELRKPRVVPGARRGVTGAWGDG